MRYIDPDKDAETKESTGGFIAKLKFWDSGPDKKKVAEAGDKFRVLIKTTGTVTTVQVLTREGGVDTSPSGRKILGLLHKELR